MSWFVNWMKKLKGVLEMENNNTLNSNNTCIMSGNTVIINGKDVTNLVNEKIHTVVQKNNKVYINGKDYSYLFNDEKTKEVTIEIHGNVDTVSSTDGNIKIDGFVNGSVDNTNGDISCHNIQGDCMNKNGDISALNVNGEVTNKNGNIRYKR